MPIRLAGSLPNVGLHIVLSSKEPTVSQHLEISARAALQRPSDRLGGPPTEAVRLRDGSTVLVRPLEPSDAELLAEGFARLSPRSRHSRFLTAKSMLTAAELRYFTDIDHVDH